MLETGASLYADHASIFHYKQKIILKSRFSSSVNATFRTRMDRNIVECGPVIWGQVGDYAGWGGGGGGGSRRCKWKRKKLNVESGKMKTC